MLATSPCSSSGMLCRPQRTSSNFGASIHTRGITGFGASSSTGRSGATRCRPGTTGPWKRNRSPCWWTLTWRGSSAKAGRASTSKFSQSGWRNSQTKTGLVRLLQCRLDVLIVRLFVFHRFHRCWFAQPSVLGYTSGAIFSLDSAYSCQRQPTSLPALHALSIVGAIYFKARR